MAKRRNPWHFGFKPSDLYDGLPSRVKKKLDDKAVEKADSLYSKTLECKPPKFLSEAFMKEVKDQLYILEDMSQSMAVYLAVSNCKPSSLATKSDKKDELERICDYFNKETPLAARVADHKKHYAQTLITSFSEELAEEGVENLMKLSKATNLEYHLTNGILLGYPLGDVFGFITSEGGELPVPMFRLWADLNDYKKNLDILVHVPTPCHWPKKWEKKVGIKGEEKLASVYRKHLKRWYGLKALKGSSERKRRSLSSPSASS